LVEVEPVLDLVQHLGIGLRIVAEAFHCRRLAARDAKPLCACGVWASSPCCLSCRILPLLVQFTV
jgi:hypothetical protein